MEASEILKYHFRYAVISATKYTNIRSQLCRLVALAFSISEPMIEHIPQSNEEAIHLLDSMLDSVCKICPKKDKKIYDAGQIFFDDIIIKRLVDALNILPALKRQVIVLHDIELMSNKQIAELYSYPVGEVCMLVHYIRAELASLYAQLWPFAREDDIKGMCENLLLIREYIDERFVADAIMEMDEE